MSQRYYASPYDTFTWPNGAIGYRSGVYYDILGPYAKVKNCPIEGLEQRYTCYATAIADTAFSIPACTRIKGKYIKGYFSTEEGNVMFHPYNGQLEELK